MQFSSWQKGLGLVPSPPQVTLELAGGEAGLLGKVPLLVCPAWLLEPCIVLTLSSPFQVLAETFTGIPAVDNTRRPAYLVRDPGTICQWLDVSLEARGEAGRHLLCPLWWCGQGLHPGLHLYLIRVTWTSHTHQCFPTEAEGLRKSVFSPLFLYLAVRQHLCPHWVAVIVAVSLTFFLL